MSRARRPDLYDSVGRSYRLTRRPDPRLAARIHAALADARTVVNVGAGTGSYEPGWLAVTAVEPSMVMITQRPRGSAPVGAGHRRGPAVPRPQVRRGDGIADSPSLDRPRACRTW